MYSLTLFKSVFDNKTHKRMDFDSWDKFEGLLYKLSELPYANKKDAQLFSPATYQPDTTRANKNVVNWAGWAAVDVDDHEFGGDLRSELCEKYGENYFICYSTASSTVGKPKFRLVFPLAEPVPQDRIRHFWFALNTHLGSIGDKQTKDLSRMYYVPGNYEGADNFIFTNKGKFIEPAELMGRHPYTEPSGSKSFLDKLPPELQEQVLAHRKSMLPNKDKYSWNGIGDCPFVNRRMIDEYKSITETGWYLKMYQFMVSVCFNAIRCGYPITDIEVEQLARELDLQTGNWYEKRPLRGEANQALNYAYKNSEV
jgi:hypothetical protein